MRAFLFFCAKITEENSALLAYIQFKKIKLKACCSRLTENARITAGVSFLGYVGS